MTDSISRSVLLLGASGQVGRELYELLGSDWQILAPSSAELDLMDEQAIRRVVRSLKPRWILNAAAYTAVDRAESEPAKAHSINADAVRVLGEEAQVCGAAVVHFSTDYVFDGTPSTPRREADATGPLGVYGCSKLAGERALAASGAAHFTFRTSWVYSTHGKNFLLTILKLARERDELQIVADQVGAPTFASNLAELTRFAMERAEAVAATEGLPLAEAVRRIGGLYHASDAGETSWFGFAKSFLELARARGGRHQRLARLKAITTEQYPTPARRPADSRLNCSLLRERLGFEMPAWQHSVEKAMDALYAGQERLAVESAPVHR